ncbi:hypothetical protein [Desulfonema magnum]|uniref:hypothetical protein n=1 Tax=Desulfonema magnum TaxID=45655 RepID=UPI001A9ABC50|nr:hypothetical protein [Desulfonema magnum]
MLIHDDIYSWEGWGRKLRLGSGSCRLRIYDLKKTGAKGLAHLRPIIIVVSDVPESKMSVKGCSSHVATCVTREFNIDPHRMLWVEYYPAKTYGAEGKHFIPEKYDNVEFVWHDDKAIHPKWRPLNPQMQNVLKELMKGT